VNDSTILKKGGVFVHNYYNSSIIKGIERYKVELTLEALQAVYPEHVDVWKQHRHRDYWRSLTNQRQFFDDLAVELDIQRPEDWYRITNKLVLERGGYFIKNLYGGSLIRGIYSP
jgi:hypothetical protein